MYKWTLPLFGERGLVLAQAAQIGSVCTSLTVYILKRTLVEMKKNIAYVLFVVA